MDTLKIHRDTLTLKAGRKVVFTAPLNSRGDGDWAVLYCVAPNTFRRFGTDTDLSPLLSKAVPVPFAQYPAYARVGSVFVCKQGSETLYLVK